MAAMPHLRSERTSRRSVAAARLAGWLPAAGMILCFSPILNPAASGTQPPPRSVLFLDQFEVASPFSTALLSSFRTTLNGNSSQPVSIYVEKLDLGRFASP